MAFDPQSDKQVNTYMYYVYNSSAANPKQISTEAIISVNKDLVVNAIQQERKVAQDKKSTGSN